MILKILFLFLPKLHFILLFICLFLRYYKNENIELINAVISIIIICIILKLSVVFHEIGHIVFGKIAGGTPRRMVLGTGNEITRFQFLKVLIVISSNFNLGLAMVAIEKPTFLKIRYFFYISGGLLTNLFFATTGIYFFGYDFTIFSDYLPHTIAHGIILSNAILFIISIVPYSINYNGLKIPNDGLQILKIPFMSDAKIKESIGANKLLDAYDYYEEKEYDKAIEIYEEFSKMDGTSFLSKLNLGVMYIKKGDYDKSILIFKNIEGLLDKKENKSYKVLVYNNISYVYLIQKDYESAEIYIQKAIEANPKDKSIFNCKGCAFIETGKIKEGVKILEKIMDLNYINYSTLSTAMYLCYGYFLLDKKKQFQKYFELVSANESLLDVDGMQLWENITTRLKPINTE